MTMSRRQATQRESGILAQALPAMDVPTALRIFGREVAKFPVDELQAWLESDFSLSGILTMEDFLRPAMTGEWPTRDVKEYEWLASERLTTVAAHWAETDRIAWPCYMAALLLHCETQLDRESPAASQNCVTVMCRAALRMKSLEWTTACLACIGAEFRARHPAPSTDFHNWVFPCQAGVALLLRFQGAQFLGLECGELLEPPGAPWPQLYPKLPKTSYETWKQLLTADGDLSLAVYAWAEERQLNFGNYGMLPDQPGGK